ncbi:capsular polysaccharide synthesis protein [Acinetobacter boissieri]|uniref:Capsular polysaccharide synthesis protein n=1 Tax=Acinetobacter boissieri TaxID=1219383 RepID=A0A1G6GFU4_9GAMM|nr:capsular polysaccharide synthesis protein [Acinetobacter boissieri]SDB80892.1 Capsular polysaccharide synthesis protein [Acinetobacter boissieri]
MRKSLERKNDIYVKKHVAQAWGHFIDYDDEGLFNHCDITAKKVLPTQKIIWQYWGQGFSGQALPEVVQLCIDSVDKYKQDYTIIRLDDETIHDYLDFPSFVLEKRQNGVYKYAFFADLLRLALLNAYGGVWLDATILLTQKIPPSILQQEIFFYQRSEHALDKKQWQKMNDAYFGWSDSHHVNVLNSIIVAKRDNPLIRKCLVLLLKFWETQESIPHYFFFQILFDVLKQRGEVNMLDLDDTLPHLLLRLIKTGYFNQSKLADVLSQSHMHKMTYFKESCAPSYYEYLKT